MITRIHWICLTAVLFVETIATTWVVVRLPSRVPLHWNLAGDIDRFGSPWELELLGPPTTLLVIGLLVGLPWIPSVGAALARSGKIYGKIAVAIAAGIAALHLAVLFPIARAGLPGGDGQHALVTADQIASPMLIVMGIIFMVLGNYLSKVRRNPVFGVRTKYTLASDAVWERTQRVSGRVFAALGLLITVMAVFCPFWLTAAVALAGNLSWCAGCHYYSRRLARSELAEAFPGP